LGVFCQLDRRARAATGWNDLEPAADLGGRGERKDFAKTAEVGKCDAGMARDLNA
jgi:hypothetical protein